MKALHKAALIGVAPDGAIAARALGGVEAHVGGDPAVRHGAGQGRDAHGEMDRLYDHRTGIAVDALHRRCRSRFLL